MMMLSKCFVCHLPRPVSFHFASPVYLSMLFESVWDIAFSDIFAIIGNNLYGADDPDRWGSLFASLFSLFVVCVLPSFVTHCTFRCPSWYLLSVCAEFIAEFPLLIALFNEFTFVSFTCLGLTVYFLLLVCFLPVQFIFAPSFMILVAVN